MVEVGRELLPIWSWNPQTSMILIMIRINSYYGPATILKLSCKTPT